MARMVVFPVDEVVKLAEQFLVLMTTARDQDGLRVIVGPSVQGFGDPVKYRRATEILKTAIQEFCGSDWQVGVK